MEFRRFLILVSSLLVLTLSQAYASGQIGILGGLAVTGATLDTGVAPNTFSASSKASYKVGIAGEYSVLPNLLSVELDFLWASYQWEQTIVAVQPSVEYTTNWFEIPLFINYTGIPMFKFGAGPVLDIMPGNVSTANSDGTGAVSQTAGAALLSRGNVSLGMQAGYDYAFSGPWTVDADIRYLLGLTNFSTNPPMVTKIHSFDFLVGVGYAF